jgi:hypothetical protein
MIDLKKETSGCLLRLVKLRGATVETCNEIARLPEEEARPALEKLAQKLLRAS